MRRRRRAPSLFCRITFVVSIALPLVILGTGARAATITVTTKADSGPGSLRAAVASASAGDTIVLPESSSDYAADSAPITVDKPLTFQGAGVSKSIVNGGGHNRVFDITPGASAGVTFNALTITGGDTSLAPGGGGVLIDSGVTGPITFNASAVDDNSVELSTGTCCSGGGGIYDAGTGLLTLNGTSVSSNSATVDSSGGCCQGGGGLFVNSSDVVISGTSKLSGNSLTVNGPPSDSGAVPGTSGSGGGALYQHSGTITVNGATFANNNATVRSGDGEHGGGAVYGGGGPMELSQTVFSGNAFVLFGPTGTDAQGTQHCCSGGGAVLQANTLEITGSSFADNSATVTAGDCCHGGGAILSTNTLTIEQTSLTGNTLQLNGNACCSGGGAIQFDPPQGPAFMTIDRSLISGNTANFDNPGGCCNGGGGIFTDALGGFYNNSTITGNQTNISSASRADWGGGGIYELIGGRPDVFTNVTLAGNLAPQGNGGGVLNNDGAASVTNSIFALNEAATGANCAGVDGFAFVSHGHNLENAPDSCNLTATGDQVVTDALIGLAGLADNGGPTLTRALELGSAAINAGDPAGCKDGNGQTNSTDQRGGARPLAGGCDIGAFELNAARARVLTGKAKGIQSSTATVSGTLAATDLATTVRFEWGTTMKYGHSSSTQTIGAGITSRSVTAVLKGLPHNQEIHFRLVAKNAVGTAHGKDRTFKTK